MTSALILAEGAEHSEHAMTLPFADFWFGVIALVVFTLLLGITWSFRHTAEKIGQQHRAQGATGAHATGTTAGSSH